MTSHTNHLIYQWFTGAISESERAKLLLLAEKDNMVKRLMEQLSDKREIEKGYHIYHLVDTTRPYREMQLRIEAKRRRKAVRAMSIAASIMLPLMVACALWFMMPSQIFNRSRQPTVAQLSLEDIHPGQTAAKIDLPDGQTILLSDTASAHKVSSMIALAKKAKTPNVTAEPEIISLDVPRGGEFKIMLEDSTEVWLNSESTLHYPEKFAEDERRVCVTGEAYFEVSKDAARPFIVESGGQVIKVYGTKFNVRGYSDEDAILTTLQTGKISVSKTDNLKAELYLYPGLQSRFDNASETVSIKPVNTDVVTSWRQGKFVFEDTPLSTIMRDLSRWYDFDYEFADPSLKHIVYMGSMDRDADIHKVISILEATGKVKITLEKNKIVVSKRKTKKK